MDHAAVIHRVSRQLSIQAAEMVAATFQLERNNLSDEESLGDEVQSLCGC